MIRKATAHWQGSGRDGKGALTTESGVLSASPYSFTTRFEGEKGTNPEELLAAAHAGCFTMAFAFGLQRSGLTAEEITTEAAVSLDRDGEGFSITRSALTLRAKIPGISDEDFRRIAADAEKNCPLSKVIKAEITLDAALV